DPPFQALHRRHARPARRGIRRSRASERRIRRLHHFRRREQALPPEAAPTGLSASGGARRNVPRTHDRRPGRDHRHAGHRIREHRPVSRFVISLLALLVSVPALLAQTPVSPAQAPATAPSTASPPDGPTLGDDMYVIEAGKKWLELLDAGKPGAAWDLASKQLQSEVKRDAFIVKVRNARKALGKLAS